MSVPERVFSFPDEARLPAFLVTYLFLTVVAQYSSSCVGESHTGAQIDAGRDDAAINEIDAGRGDVAFFVGTDLRISRNVNTCFAT
jgi:hypothetical protein